MSSAKAKLDALTGARGIAAWFVVFYHIRHGFTDAVPQGLIDVFAKGYLAVDLFFVLSGFVMWLNYGSKFQAQGYAASTDFLRRRIARIYPLHAAILTAMVVYVALLAFMGKATGTRYPWEELPLHYLLMQNWGMTPQLSWNDPAWSISTELGAYLVFAAVAPLVLRKDWGVAKALAGIALLCLALGSFMIWRDAATLGHGIVTNGLIRCVAEFFMGVFLCMVWQKAEGHERKGILLACGTCAILGGAWAMGMITEHFAVPAIFVATVYLIAQGSNRAGNPLSSRIAVYIGDISYSTYLVHFFLWIIFKKFVADAHNVPLWSMAVFVVMVLAASAILHRLIEEPGRKLLQGLARKPHPATSVA